MVKVNIEQSKKVGKLLKQYTISKRFLEREFQSFNADRETKLRMYLLSSAICHQTHNLHDPIQNLWGWEYMEYGFLKMLKEGNPLLNPGYLSICCDTDVSIILKEAFSPDGKPEHSTLDRIEERTQMLLEICRVVKISHKGRVSDLIDQSGGRLINNGNGLYEILSRFKGFSDPRKKKITFFLKLATDAGVLSIRDPENCIPIMDYHMQRVLLRTGCVDITDTGLREQLTQRIQLVSDEPVRGACIEAIRIIARASGYSLFSMNDFFWPLGRSCCNNTLLCRNHHCEKSPCTLPVMIDIPHHDACILESVCKGRNLESYRKLYEPVTDTHFY
jgi:hypothetical protein